MNKLKGCLITDMENLQQEYYCLWNEAAKKRDNAIKERDYNRCCEKADSYSRCYEKMKQVLKFINTL